MRTPWNGTPCGSDSSMIDLLCARDRHLIEAIVDVCGRRAVDQQAQQFRTAVMPTGVHLRLSAVDQREVENGDHLALTRPDRLAQELALRCDDRSEAATGDRPGGPTARVSHYLRLLIGVEPSRGIHHKGARLERMITHAYLDLSREQLSTKRSGPHGRVDLLTVGDQRITGKHRVMLPAGQGTDASHNAVDCSQAAAVTLTPNHAFVIGGCDLAAAL